MPKSEREEVLSALVTMLASDDDGELTWLPRQRESSRRC